MTLGLIVGLIKSLIRPLKTAIQGVSKDVSKIESVISIPFAVLGVGYVIYSDGLIYQQSDNFGYTDYVDLKGAKQITYKRTQSTGANPAHGIAFYDVNKAYISGIQSQKNAESYGYGSTYTAEVPENAKYARFTVCYDITSHGDFALQAKGILQENNITQAVHALYLSGTNDDGTKNILKSDNEFSCAMLVFTPEENTQYEIEASGNSRLRVYGSKVFYDPLSYNKKHIVVSTIIESDDLTHVTFNSGDYATIFVYLQNVEYTSHIYYEIKQLTGANKLNKINDRLIIQKIDTKKVLFDAIPFADGVLPANALQYHALWDGLVNKGLVERSTPTYMSADTGHNYPLYTYTVKAFNQYINTDYDISQNELQSIYERPKVIVVSGHHGDEPCTPFALFHFFKRMLEMNLNADLLSKYEWTIIPLVNPVGYNNRSRYNSQGYDINRDYNDSNGFETEEARYVRDVFLGDDYVLAVDLHQAPDLTETDFTSRISGFVKMNTKQNNESQQEFDEVKKEFCKNVQIANSRTDRYMMFMFGWENIEQTSFIWDSTSENNSFQMYSHGCAGNTAHTDHKTKLSIVLETSTRCPYLSHDLTRYNNVAIQYTNEYVEEVIRATTRTIDSTD